jgi:hypothetical protein
MANNLLLKQQEAKRITLTLTEEGAPVDLTGATLTLGVKKSKSDAEFAFSKADAAFNKSQAANGIISVFLSSSDLDQEAGVYVGELKIAFADPDGTIDKSADLGIVIGQAVTT